MNRSFSAITVVTNTIETIDISFRRMLIDGPEVSLKGSPTVSPTTAALCGKFHDNQVHVNNAQ